jgi:hypothetical protein
MTDRDTRTFRFDNRIAPRDSAPDPHHFLTEMLRGAYDHGTVLRYHDLDCSLIGRAENVWRVDPAPHVAAADGTGPLAVVNLRDFRTAGAVGDWLADLRAED